MRLSVAHELRVFKNHVRQLLQGDETVLQQPVAIALSGGLDSVALSWLWHKAFSSDPEFPRPAVHAFIVDHKLRPSSTQEAHITANRFKELTGRKAWIIDLDWNAEGGLPQFSRLETEARRLRYQAIARGCRQHNIKFLLTGHHADDQAETVFSRLINGAKTRGLSAMAPLVPLPECETIYGVNDVQESAFRRPVKQAMYTPALRQGVQVLRPLLTYRKDYLRRICVDQELPWVEDETNRIATLTQRNAIRGVLASQHLPRAFQVPRLLQLAEKTGQADRHEYEQVQNLHNQDLKKTFDRPNSTLSLRMPPLGSTPRSIFTCFVRDIVNAISRTAPRSRADCVGLANYIYDAEDSAKNVSRGLLKSESVLKLFQRAPVVGDVRAFARISKEDLLEDIPRHRWSFVSLPRPRQQEKDATIHLRYFEAEDSKSYHANPDYPAPTLWDGRLWIKVRVSTQTGRQQGSHESFVLRALTNDEFTEIRKGRKLATRRHLDQIHEDQYQSHAKLSLLAHGGRLPSIPLLASVSEKQHVQDDSFTADKECNLSNIIAVPAWSFFRRKWKERLAIEVAHRSLGQNFTTASQMSRHMTWL